MLPTLPARSVMRNAIALLLVLLASKLALQLMAVPLAVGVMTLQVAPPSSEPSSTSPAVKAPLSTPVMVCAAVLVMRSVLKVPVSALSATPETLTSEAAVSST